MDYYFNIERDSKRVQINIFNYENIMKIFLFFTIIFITTQLGYSENTTKQDKLTRFVMLFKPDQIIKTQKENCYKSLEKYSLEYMYKKNPSSFFNITPGTKYWTEAVKLYDDYQSVRCTFLKEDEVIDFYIDTYDKLLTEKELDELLIFYQTPIGIKLVDVWQKATKSIQNYYKEKALEAYDTSLENYQKKLAELRKKAYYGE